MDDVYRDPDLAAAQGEMLELFHAGGNPAELMEKIAASGIKEDIKAWLLSCDPDMLETACDLVRQWGTVDPARGVGAGGAPVSRLPEPPPRADWPGGQPESGK